MRFYYYIVYSFLDEENLMVKDYNEYVLDKPIKSLQEIEVLKEIIAFEDQEVDIESLVIDNFILLRTESYYVGGIQ